MERFKMYSKVLPINEMYLAVQCEGKMTGMPVVMVRFSGCTHRCYFGNGGWCDSWQSSIHPEKGKFKLNDLVQLIEKNPQIHGIVLTGGSPTMYPKYVNEILYIASEHSLHTSMETEGSHICETDIPLDLVTLSPKFSNSIPVLGITTPKDKIVDQKFIDQHNKFRMNKDVMMSLIRYHTDYQFKPVWDGTESTLNEIEKFRIEMGIPKKKTYMMPAGDNREQLIKMYPIVMEKCIEMGYNFTGRPHIIAYDMQRCV